MPPTSFTWAPKDSDGKYREKPQEYTPKSFYEKFVGLDFQNNYVMLMNDPSRPYWKSYEIAYDRHVYEGHNWLYVNLPIEEINEMDQWEGAQLNRAKEILAFELTKMVHGEEEAAKAQEGARALFSAGNTANMPTTSLSADDFTDGAIDILTLLVKTGLVPSKSEARRAVEQGGVTANGEKVTDIKATFTTDAFKDGIVLKRGKKSFMKVTY